MTTGKASLAQIEATLGQALPPTRWFEITQDMINAHADTHQDWQYIHVDPVRAAKTPFGGPVAHGFLTLSMLSAMVYDTPLELDGATVGVNYGFEKIRFISPVLAGSRVRGVFTPTAVKKRRADEIMITLEVLVEIEGTSAPALAATWLNLYFFETESP